MFDFLVPRSVRRAVWLPVATFLAGLLMTYVAQDVAHNFAWQESRHKFAFHVQEIISRVQTRLSDYEQVLQGTAGFMNAVAEMDRQKFSIYVESLNLQERFPGIQSLGFAQVVLPHERSLHTMRMRAQGLPNYALFPSGERSLYSSIVFTEPATGLNLRTIGFDMYAEPVRREAMNRARDNAAVSMSRKVRLKQDGDSSVSHPGVLLYLPIYQKDMPYTTLAQRQFNLSGWIFAAFRMDDLMRGILGRYMGDASVGLELLIYDGEMIAPDKLMFNSVQGVLEEHLSDTEAHEDAFVLQHTLSVFGHEWTLLIRTSEAFAQGLPQSRASIVVVTGTILSLLLSLVVWLLVTGRERAEALAENMTYELRQTEQTQKRLNRTLRLLTECNAALLHAEHEQSLLNEVCRLSVDTGDYVMVWIGYLSTSMPYRMIPMAQMGGDGRFLKDVAATADTYLMNGPTARAALSGQPVVCSDFRRSATDELWHSKALGYGYGACVSLPLPSSPTHLGAMSLYASAPHTFTPEELHLLSEMAKDLAFGIGAMRTRIEHEAAKEQIAFLAHFDPLTHLPNRLLLRDRFEQLRLMTADNHYGFALLYVDIDKFQEINDSFGHSTGDKVLVETVERLRQYISPSDTISRISSDEFVILLTGADKVHANEIVTALLEAFIEPLDIQGQKLHISLSIGVCWYPENGQDFETLLKCADTAVGRVKEDGGHGWRFYTDDMNVDLKEQMRLASGLLHALHHGELLLHYQPQINLATGQIIGAEALIRWKHPEDGMIPPGRFIPLAERNGQILQIGEWVLNEACRQAQQWLNAHSEPFLMAVNMSALQFKRSNVLEVVMNALNQSGLSPSCLELELTESMLMQDVDSTKNTLRQLKSLGVKLSIDDFGTGYSSLAYLRHLTVDKLKVDQSFVRDMLANTDSAAIVKAIIQLGNSLQLNVLAEGVETELERNFLAISGCHEAQGYLFSRPVTAEEFGALLAQDRLKAH